jgi:hypothetical protein
MALLDDLRVLGTLLPPSEHVSSGEVGDVLSALIAHEEHGHALTTDAASGGSQGVHNFFHEVIAKFARDKGLPKPVKGAPVVPEPQLGQPAPVQGPTGVDPAAFAQLAAAVAALTAKLEKQTAELEKQAEPMPAPESAPILG